MKIEEIREHMLTCIKICAVVFEMKLNDEFILEFDDSEITLKRIK